MAISRVQRVQGYVSDTVSATVTAGNLLIVVLQGFGAEPFDITDTLSNTWIKLPRCADGSNAVIMWYCWNCIGGSTTVTQTGVTSDSCLNIIEYTGLTYNGQDPLVDKNSIVNVGNPLNLSVSTEVNGLMVSYWGNQVSRDYVSFNSGGTQIWAYGGQWNAGAENLSTSLGTSTMSINVGAIISGGSPNNMFILASFREIGNISKKVTGVQSMTGIQSITF